MKKSATLVIIFVLFFAGRVYAQSNSVPSDPSAADTTIDSSTTFSADESGPTPAVLTSSGSPFVAGSADNQCKIADAGCTLPNGQAGLCVDNGQGKGVCAPKQIPVDPLFDTKCDPKSICHIPPEKVGRRNDVGQSKTKEWGQQNPTGSLWSFVQNWIGEVKPQAIYHYGSPLLTSFGFQVFDSFSKDLLPASQQNMLLYDVQPKPYCMTARLCVYDPVTHALVGNYLTHETWCTTDPPARKELIMGTRLACGAMSKCNTSMYLQLPYTAVKKIAALGCSAKLQDGRSMDLENLPYIKQNYYGDDTITHFAITVQADMVSIIQRFIEKLQKTVDIFVSTEHTPAVEVGSAENGMSASLAGVSFTVTKQDLKPFAYPGDAGKAALAKGGGVWDTYRGSAMDVAFQSKTDARFETQDWFYGMAGEGTMTSPTLQSMNARQENAQLAGNCNIFSAGDPTWKTLGCDKMNWTGGQPVPGAPSEPPSEPNIRSSAITDSNNASSGTTVTPISPHFTVKPISSSLVPSCVLEGIATVEGAYEGGAPCQKNECGAYGPFQITTGSCKPSCGASSCPNEQKAYGATLQQLCDFSSAANIAASILVGKANYWGTPLSATAPIQSQKAAIINAADSYYGVGWPIQRLGGLSYGEFVYAHCSPGETVTHVDHQAGHYPQ